MSDCICKTSVFLMGTLLVISFLSLVLIIINIYKKLNRLILKF